MFKSKKGSNHSSSKQCSNDYVSKNASCVYNDESNTPSSKKSKRKNLFNSLRNKLSSVFEGKHKGSAEYSCRKTSRSKSFEVLSNSFEDSHERTSSSEESGLDRGKRGSRRSQSVRSKQTICPAEFEAQIASTSVRTGFQNEDNEADVALKKENEVNHWTNSYLNNSSLSTNSVTTPTEALNETSPISSTEKDKSLETEKAERKKNPQTVKTINSPQRNEGTPIKYNHLGISASPCLDDGECKSLAKEIRELSKCGWYWGPLNRTEAEEKLADEPDGAFLVRDSSDVKYLLSLSFQSYGKTLHARIEHSNGWFSFYPQPDHDSYRSLVDLINHCMLESDGGVFCYSRPLIKGSPSYPVRLTKPVSRFMQVRSLQYLCRFVIRQYTSINHIQNLPIPPKIQGYLKESYY